MNKFSFSLAVAAMTCAAGLSACKDDKKPADTAAPAASTAPAPASEPAKPAEPPAMAPAVPAAPEKKSEAPAAPATEMAAAAPPAAEAPKAADPTPAPEAPKADAAKSADAKPAETAAAAPASAAPAETKVADAKPADAAPAPAADAKPADAAAPAGDIKDRTSPPDPVSEMAKEQGIKFTDGRYRNKDGDPQPVVTKEFMVDWGTWNGFRRYHDACHVCHGPNANGSTFAPALKESLKTIDYGTFVATVSGGKQENRGGTMFVMPSFGTDKNIMCYLDDIYTYIKARSINDASGGKEGMPAGRPNGREDITDETKAAADDCTK